MASKELIKSIVSLMACLNGRGAGLSLGEGTDHSEPHRFSINHTDPDTKVVTALESGLTAREAACWLQGFTKAFMNYNS